MWGVWGGDGSGSAGSDLSGSGVSSSSVQSVWGKVGVQVTAQDPPHRITKHTRTLQEILLKDKKSTENKVRQQNPP